MSRHRHITCTRQGDVCCVRLKHARLEENEIQQLGDEILSLFEDGTCRNLALSLGPETPYCLYSVFLAKLVAIRNALAKLGGSMVLCDVAPNAYDVFEACQLNREFVFVADIPAALEHFRQQA